MKNARPSNAKTSAREQGDSKSPATFVGTDNPRHLRVIHAVWVRPMPREQLDTVAGCSNGPDLVAELRRRGLQMPCTRTKKFRLPDLGGSPNGTSHQCVDHSRAGFGMAEALLS